MKNRTSYLFVAIMLATGLCHSHARGNGSINSQEPAVVEKAKWTVMVYMNADNDLDDFAIRDFNEMAKVQDTPLVNVVLQLDRIDGDNTDESWGETRRFLMKKDLKPTRCNALLGFNEESNMGDLTTLRSFVAWAKENYPAERYILILWSHGDGWRRFTNEPSDRKAAKRIRDVSMAEELLIKDQITDSALASLNLVQTSVEPQYRTLSEDQTNDSDMLYVREIQDALESVFKGDSRLKLIGFDACLMQMIETAYAMRNVAEVMVGSEELVPADGWQYSDWLETLIKNPDMNESAVGKLLVNSYRETYKNEKPNTTLSAIKLSGNEIERVATAVSDLARELTISLATELSEITKARLNCFVYARGRRYQGIDLRRFATQIAAANVRPQLKASAKEVTTLIDSLVICNYAGSLRQGEFGSHGLAIYFPVDNRKYQADRYKDAYTDENEFQVIQFVREHRWDNFLHAYFKLV